MSQTVAMLFGSALEDWVPTDGTQGVPSRTTGTRKKKGGDPDNWSAFDLKMHKREDLMAAKVESSRWIADFQQRVRLDLVDRGILPRGEAELTYPDNWRF